MSKTVEHSSTYFNELTDQLFVELRAMIQFAASRGEKIPVQALVILKSQKDELDLELESIKVLVKAHASLSSIVKPALPRNIVYLQQRNEIFKKSKGLIKARFPFQRKLVLFSCVAIIILILSGQSELVNADSLSKGILGSSGKVLFINFIYLCSSAAIGATFWILSNLKSKYQNGTYNPDQDVNSWTIILLGIISGIIMSQLIPIDESVLDSGKSMIHYNRALFALLGGFSSKIIYNFLNKIIIAIGSIVSPDGSSAENDIRKVKIDQEDTLNRTKNNISNKLIAIKGLLPSSPEAGSVEINEKIDGLIAELGELD